MDDMDLPGPFLGQLIEERPTVAGQFGLEYDDGCRHDGRILTHGASNANFPTSLLRDNAKFPFATLQIASVQDGVRYDGLLSRAYYLFLE